MFRTKIGPDFFSSSEIQRSSFGFVACSITVHRDYGAVLVKEGITWLSTNKFQDCATVLACQSINQANVQLLNALDKFDLQEFF